jgi:hypothetical protein
MQEDLMGQGILCLILSVHILDDRVILQIHRFSYKAAALPFFTSVMASAEVSTINHTKKLEEIIGKD